MPLKSGRKAVSDNIGEIMRSYRKTGKIGTSTPKSPRDAIRQAIAISFTKARTPKKLREGGVMRDVSRIVKKKDGKNPVKIY